MFKRIPAALITAFACVALSLAMAATGPRVVAVGDVHGAYDAFVGILQRASLLDSNLRWSGGNAVLVQTGDFIDRGPKSHEVMDLLMRLQREARRQNGRVIVLLGNHEAMNIYGDLRYVTPEDYASFVDARSPSRRAAAGSTMPLGFVEQRDAFGPTGSYGRWLRSLPAVVKIGDSLFVHGGLKAEFATWKVERINEAIAADLKAFDAIRKYMVDEKIIHPYDTLGETITAVRAAEKLPESKDPRRRKVLDSFQSFGSWMTINMDGPLWFRGYDRWDEAEGSPQLRQLTQAFGVKRIVVGHTPQAGKIVARFNGQVYLIDTGMLSSYVEGGRASALEIIGDKITPIY